MARDAAGPPSSWRESDGHERGSSDTPFRLFVESVRDYAIFMLDPAGHVTTWNAGAERLKGYTAEEMLGKHFSVLYTEEDRRRHHPEHELDIAREQGRYEEQGWRRRKDGTRFYAHVVITAVRDRSGWLVGFGKVTRDLTEEKRRQEHERDLRREQIARAEAEAANRAKSEFLAVMSHELRTPLNAMLGYIDLLLMGIPETIPDASKAHVERVRASAHHLLGLIEPILTFSRIEAGQEGVDVVEVDAVELIRDAAALVKPLAEKKALRFEVHVPETQVSIKTDPARLHQILLNLLSNAIKYTEVGGVELRLCDEADWMVVQVRDTGVGISSEEQELIFEPFRQLRHGSAHDRGGTGLGLSVTRSLAMLLGGSVGVESTPGEWSTFTVRLPRDLSARTS